jgi:hypothetical protein
VLEPGGMRTDWAGSSMTIAAVSAPYEATVGAVVRRMDGFSGTEAGDVAKVAQVVLQVTELEEPPLRLLLGSDAFTYATAAGERRAQLDQQWRELSVSTDHDDAHARNLLDPLSRQA